MDQIYTRGTFDQYRMLNAMTESNVSSGNMDVNRNRAYGFLRTITGDPVTRRKAGAIEQALINRNPNFSNKINSISPKRVWYDEAVKWGVIWLKENGY